MYKKNNKYFVYRGIKDVDEVGCKIINSFRSIEVDEILAEPIRMLNNKGYITKTSCSSHYLKDASIKLVDKHYVYDGTYEILDRKSIGNNEYEFSLYNICAGDGLYIQFDESIKLSSLPNGWVLESKFNIIKTDVSTDNYCVYLSDLCEKLMNLMIWVKNIKEIKVSAQGGYS